MKNSKFPQFDSYALEGDSIKWHAQGFDFIATLERDNDASPLGFDCYSPIKVKQWKNDEWFFVGVVLGVSINGIELEDHAASVWGVDCNYNKRSNRYLSEVAREMESEALEVARARVSEMLEKLGAAA